MGYPRTRSARPKVQWKDDSFRPNTTLSTFPHVPDNSTAEEIEIRTPYLYKGALWRSCCSLWEDGRFSNAYYLEHEYKYLVREMWQSSSAAHSLLKEFRPGFLAIYIGEVRVEEDPFSRNRKAKSRYVRHTFLMGGTIYMACNLCDFEPVF